MPRRMQDPFLKLQQHIALRECELQCQSMHAAQIRRTFTAISVMRSFRESELFLRLGVTVAPFCKMCE